MTFLLSLLLYPEAATLRLTTGARVHCQRELPAKWRPIPKTIIRQGVHL